MNPRYSFVTSKPICNTCGAYVDINRCDQHDAWHEEHKAMAERVDTLSRMLQAIEEAAAERKDTYARALAFVRARPMSG